MSTPPDYHNPSADQDHDHRRVLLTKAEIRELAREVAEETVRQISTQLGFNLDEPFEVQADMRYLRELRGSSRKLTWSVIGSMVTVAVTGLALAAWAGAKLLLKD